MFGVMIVMLSGVLIGYILYKAAYFIYKKLRFANGKQHI